MKKITVLFILIVFIVKNACADAVEIDGIYYNLITKGRSAEVVSGPKKYTGKIDIPAAVSYEGLTYNVSIIRENAFYQCYDISSITIPNSIKTIGVYAFYQCRGISSIIIPNGVEIIENYAFIGCQSLSSINIPSSVKSIGSQAFYDCTKLEAVYITDLQAWLNIQFASSGANPLSYGQNLYLNGELFTNLEIPDGVESIGAYSFYNCKSLTSITIPNSVKSMGLYATEGCENISSVNIFDLKSWLNITFDTGANPLYYAKHLFLNGKEIKDVVIPDDMTEIKSLIFEGYTNLNSITFHNKITSIGDAAFYGCAKLKDINIPNSVNTIRSQAFQNCSGLSSVTIGSGVVTIGDNAFSECKGLENLICLPKAVPQTGKDVFKDSYPEYVTLHVPVEALNKYKTAEPWSGFGRIVSISGEEQKKCEKPTILYENGKLKFSCTTEGAEFISKITDSDIKDYYSREISLTATYNISVYATATGYENSDIVTATLCWIEAEPKAEGIESGVANVRANPVLVQNNGSIITVSGNIENIPIYIYDVSGRKMGEAIGRNGIVDIDTRLMTGDVAVVKIGDKSIKVLLK